MRIRDNPIIFLTRLMWKYSEGNRRQIVLYFSLFAAANMISLIGPLIVAAVLNTIQEQGVTAANISSIALYLSLFIAIELGFWLFHGPARVIESRNAFLVRANYKKYLLEGTMALPAQWHTDHHSGDTIDKIEKATDALYSYSSDTWIVVQSVILFIGSYVALAYFNLHASYIVLVMVILTVITILKFDRVLIGQYRDLFRAENRISAKIFDVISNITTVIVLRIERLVSTSIMRKVMHPFPLFVTSNKVNEMKWFIVSLLSAIMMFLVLFSFVYFHFIQGSAIMIGTVFALYAYVDRIDDIFFRFTYKYGEIVRQKTAILNVEEIAKEFSQKEKIRQVRLGSSWQRLSIEALKFSYHTKEGADLHLDNISLPMKRGEHIALIGESGSGKTTLLKVMRQLYRPRHVRVFVDGKLLPNGFGSISDDISLIPQEPEIFSTTIKENITVGAGYRLSYVKTFTDMARFTEVANRLPKRFNSSIVEKGVNLSGGEKQRLALARGLLASVDKEILLLDEPTSSVDFRNELLIYHNIFTKFSGKTIVSSVHRLHLLPLFDTIYFFKGGRIAASGTLDELLRQSKEFRRMWEKYNRARTGR